jgi:RimJ/RimL family protein N-acetyltransferase
MRNSLAMPGKAKKLERIAAIIEPTNLSSQRVMMKVGMKSMKDAY